MIIFCAFLFLLPKKKRPNLIVFDINEIGKCYITNKYTFLFSIIEKSL